MFKSFILFDFSVHPRTILIAFFHSAYFFFLQFCAKKDKISVLKNKKENHDEYLSLASMTGLNFFSQSFSAMALCCKKGFNFNIMNSLCFPTIINLK